MVEREDALLASARALFLDLGFDRVTVEAIARTAHVSPKTIYARYGGKEGLFISAMLPAAERLTATLDEDPTDERGAERALARFGERLLLVSLSPGALRFQRLIASDGGRFPKLARAFYANGPARGLKALASFFARCDRNGVLSCPHPDDSANSFSAHCKESACDADCSSTNGPRPRSAGRAPVRLRARSLRRSAFDSARRRLASHAARTVGPYHRFMKNILIAITTCAALAVSVPANAADYRLDGQLPMYPHAQLDPKEASLTPAAIAQGVPLVLLTSDSVATVDAWYASHVAKQCTRQVASGAMKYACPGGSIMIYAHAGQTQIAFVPPMMKF